MDPWHVPPPRDKAFLVEFGEGTSSQVLDLRDFDEFGIVLEHFPVSVIAYQQFLNVFDINVKTQQTIKGASGRVALGATL